MTNKSKIAKAGLGLLAGVVMFAGVTVSAMTQSQAAALVASLGITGANATALVAALTTEKTVATPSTGSCFTFTKSLSLGTKSADVMELQKVLNSDADTALAVAAGTTGSAGHESSTFGPATKAAVMKYQAKHTISPKSGLVGALTMKTLNASCTTPTTPTTPGTTPVVVGTGPVTVALSSDNPQAGNLIMGQATADLAHFTFNGAGTVTQVTLQRTGISDNSVFTNVYLYNGNTRLTDSASVNSQGQIIFNGTNIVVNGPMTVSVRADIIGTSTNSESTVAVTLTGYKLSGSTAATAVNLAANSFYINSGTGVLSTVSVGTNTAAGGPGASTAQVSAGTTNYSLWSAPVTVSLHPVSLKAANFKFIGSAPMNAFANVGLYANGVKIGTSAGINSNNYIAFDLSSTAYTMITGATTLEVRADIMNGASRTAELTLQNSSDLMVTDTQAMANVGVTNTGGALFTQNAAGTVSIQAGSIVASIDPAFNSMTNVTGGATNVEIAGYTLTSYGEDVKINTLTVTPVISGTPAACSALASGAVAVQNVTLYYNGSPVGSSQNGVSTGGCTMGTLTFNPGSNLTVYGGTTGTFQVHADLLTGAGTPYAAGTVTATVVVASGNTQGMTSGTTGSVTFPAANALNITTGSLTIGKNAGFLGQTVSPNTSGAMIGSFTIQNNSTSEGVQVNSIAVNLYSTGDSGVTDVAMTASTPVPTTNFSTMTLTGVPGTAPTPIGQPTGTNTFSTNFVIPAGGSVTVNVNANLGSTSANAVVLGLVPTAVGSNSRVTVTTSEVKGQVMTLGTGSLNAPVLISSQSTAAQYVSSGGTGASKVAQNSYNFVATTGTAKIIGLKFAAYTNSALLSSGSSSALVSGATTTLTSSAAFTGANWAACTTGSPCSVLVNTTGLYGGTNLLGTAVFVSSSTLTVTITQNMVYGTTTAGGATVGVPGNVYLLSTAPTAVDLTATGVAVGTGSFNNGIAYISTINGGSGAIVPNNPSGITLPVFISYAPVSTTGGITSGTAPTLLLEYVQYQSGSNTTTMAPAVGGTTITLVGSKPNITVNAVTNGLTAGSDVLLGTVTVTADNTGDIAIASLPINVSISAGASGGSPTLSANSLKITDNNDATLAYLTTTNISTTSTATSTNVFGSAQGNHYRISYGQSKTFEIRGTITGSFGTSASVSVSLGSAGQFAWDDINGNNIDTVSTAGAITVTGPQVTPLTGSLLYAYPTGSVSIHN